MTDPPPVPEDGADRFHRQVEAKEDRKLGARRRPAPAVWFGLGMFGLVGWSVAIPTLVATVVGVWIDANWPSRYSWTLMLLFLGISLGCWNAWTWVRRESRE